MNWWQQRLCAFDTETTSADPREARIVAAAVVELGGSEEPWTWKRIVNPGVPIPYAASLIHGITNKIAEETGMVAGDAIAEIVALLESAWDSEQAVVICNAPYDLTVLSLEYQRVGLGSLDPPGWIIDPQVLDRYIDRRRAGKRKLADLCKLYGAVHDGAHDACADAIAAARVAYRIGQRNPGLGSLTLEQLHRLQAAVYVEQRADLKAYFEKKGKPFDDDGREWPVMNLEGRQECFAQLQ